MTWLALAVYMSSHDLRIMRTLVGGMIEWVECSFEYEKYTLAHPFKRVTVSSSLILDCYCILCSDLWHLLKCSIAPFVVIYCTLWRSWLYPLMYLLHFCCAFRCCCFSRPMFVFICPFYWHVRFIVLVTLFALCLHRLRYKQCVLLRGSMVIRS